MIFATEERLAGSMDFVAVNERGQLIIYDWKRCKDLKSKYCNVWQNMLHPLSSMPDCSGLHYRLQHNIYRYILQKYYCAEVAGMFVVCVHPDNDADVFVDEVPVLDYEISLMMQHQRAKARNGSDPLGSRSTGVDGVSSKASVTASSLGAGILLSELGLRPV